MSNLKDRAVSGIIWSLIERFGNQGIQFFIGLILARLLLPADFGLVGMLMIFIALAQSFVDGGFSAALIRKQNAIDADYSTVFWFNLGVAVLFYILIFFSAPAISDFYNEPALSLLARVLALIVIINSIGLIQKTILIKKLDFKTQAIITIYSIFIGGMIGIFTAWNDYGVWALVAQTLSRGIFINFFFWIKSEWRPQFIFSIRSFKELFGFGSKLLASGIIFTLSDNLYSLVIGKLFSAQSLGYYTRANQFQKLPVSSVYGAINAVSFPVMAQLQNDDVKLKNAYRSLIKMAAFLLFPVMGILATVSYPMISVILTDKWLPSVPLLQVLCIVGAFFPLHAINLNILNVKGRSDLFLKLEIIKQFLNIVTIIISYRWGVIGLVWGMVILNFVSFYLNSLYPKRIINYGFFDQLKDLFIYIVLSGLMLLVLQVINFFISNNIILLFVIPLSGVTFYFTMAYLLNVKELYKIKEVINKKLFKL